ncbi:sulfotransferase family 2 domain-containing protein [Desulfopila aestuarii]|uniref:Sulfotransferase family protein n=1 Tax=Desulfopila aestuarii DSM 18488 TaxID=1121416 RepID=A0A1M7Y1P6_9BACT|nr:sulfotransferase family 2 domain-containing protein [Desulfopila aestuarii]SHO45753.1 Sulfotransferase family protein [Desulfopila aestuarii DSM 18488]
MIISHNYKFIFIHIPKCAGTSIRNCLLELDPEAVSYWGNAWALDQDCHVDAAHQPIENLVKNRDLLRMFRKYFVFAFVRNPYERFLSSLAEFGRERSDPLNLSDILELLPSLTPNAFLKNVRYIHFCPMHYFTHIGNKRWVDQIYDFANLEAGLLRFSQTIGISPDKILPLPSLNISKNVRQPSVDVLTNKVIAAVNNIYHQDFELFGYSSIETVNRTQSFNQTSPFAEIRATPEQFGIIAPLLSKMKELDEERRNLLKEQRYLFTLLRHIDNHIVFGKLLRFWRRYVNQSFPALPTRDSSNTTK